MVTERSAAFSRFSAWLETLLAITDSSSAEAVCSCIAEEVSSAAEELSSAMLAISVTALTIEFIAWTPCSTLLVRLLTLVIMFSIICDMPSAS